MGCECDNLNAEEKKYKSKERPEQTLNLEDPSYNNNQKNNINTNNNYMNSDDKSNEYLKNNIQRNLLDDNYIQKLEDEYNINNMEYSSKIVKLINSIRQNPSSYADTIENSIQNIIIDHNKNRIIYQDNIKVALTRGEPVFHESAKQLRGMKPLPPLEFSSKMCIPLPKTEEEMNDSNFLRSRVKELREKGIDIDVFFKDLVKIPEVSALLMIVDDSNKNPGKKRMALLNKDFKYIGVNSKFIGKTFIAYFAFSQ